MRSYFKTVEETFQIPFEEVFDLAKLKNKARFEVPKEEQVFQNFIYFPDVEVVFLPNFIFCS
jgi:hypothetical protein